MRRFIAGPVAAVVLAAVTALPARAQTFNYFTTGQFTGGGTTCNYAVDAATQTCGGVDGGLGLTFTGATPAVGGYASGSTIQLGTFTPVGSGSVTLSSPNVMFRLFVNQTDPTTGSASVVGAFTGTFTQGDGANFSNIFWSPNQQSLVIGPTTYTLIFDNAVNGQGPNDCPTAQSPAMASASRRSSRRRSRRRASSAPPRRPSPARWRSSAPASSASSR